MLRRQRTDQVSLPIREIILGWRGERGSVFMGKSEVNPTDRYKTAEPAMAWIGSILTRDAELATFSVKPRRGEKNKGDNAWVDLASFRVVPVVTAPRFLIPTNSREVAASALKIYNPQKISARLRKWLFSAALRLGIAEPFVHDKASIQVRADVPQMKRKQLVLIEYLKEIFGTNDLVIGVSFGNPGTHQKPMVQVMNSRGEILGYAKVGWNADTVQLVQKEETALRSLEGHPFSTAIVPRVISGCAWNGCYLLARQAPPCQTSRSADKITPRHVRFLSELHAVDSFRGVLAESKFYQELQGRIHFLQGSKFSSYARIMHSSIASVPGSIAGANILFGLRHGDFTPWNILRAADRLFVFDWEYVKRHSPPAWDLFHFIVQTAILLQRRSAEQILQSIAHPSYVRRQVENYFDELGISYKLILPFFVYYLADVSSLYLRRDGEGGGRQGELLRRTWSSLLILTLRGEIQAAA